MKKIQPEKVKKSNLNFFLNKKFFWLPDLPKELKSSCFNS
jgi:hypothetical protein